MNATPKPLVLCADDYAQDVGVSQAVLALARRGRLSATSAMVLAPRWAEDAAALGELRGALDVGLHLDFTSPFALARGHGVSLAAAMRRAAWRGFDVEAARLAIEQQLDAFERAWRAPPDHVDGHQHVQQFAGIRAALVAALARRYGPRGPWLRLSRPPPGQGGFKDRVIAAWGAGALQRLARQHGLPCAPALSGVYGFDGDQAAYARRMRRWLAQAPAGTVLMCHPSADTAAATGDAIAAARWHEFQHLASPAFAEQLVSAGVQLARGSTLYSAPT